jgi:hypothetical protein
VGWLAAGGFVAAALVAAPAHGLAFDSHIWFPFGDRILGWLAGRAPRPFNLLTEPFEAYGSTAALAASATSALLHDRLGLVGPVVGHHAFVVLSGGALVGLAAYLGARVAGARAGALAALLLATAPRFFFEAETNVSDVPAAVAWTAVLVALWHALEAGRTAPLLAAAAAAAALGAVRLTNLLFLPAVPVLWLVCSGDARRRAWALAARGPWWRLPLAAATLAAAFVLARPLAWPAPWATLRTVFDRLLVPPYWTSKGVADVFFLGTLHGGGPPSFHPVMLAVTTPLPFLAALAPGLVVLFRRRRAAAWLLVAWIAVVLGRHAFLGRGNYDGVRHVIDAFPALAVLGGVGVEAVLAAAAARAAPRARAAVWALGTLVAGAGATAIVRLHPYAVAYYNPLVGGLAGAAARFETEYSGVAYREALLWAAHELGPEDRLWITRDYDRGLVAVEAAWLGLDGPRLWRPGDAEPAAAPRRLVTMQILRPGPFERPAGRIPAASLPIVYEIRRDGVTLLRAREVPPARRAEIAPGGG